MQVPNLGVSNPGLPTSTQVDAASTPPTESTVAATPTFANGYQPSAQLQQLIGLARQEPEVRGDRVQAALQRLQDGFYQTQASVDDTADAMMALAE